MTTTTLTTPALMLAADHRARGVVTIEDYNGLLEAMKQALPACDGILASVKPLEDLVASGAVTPQHQTYLSVNRTGLAGAAFELDDRLVATVARAAADGYSGIKHMTRIDLGDPYGAPALELLGTVIDQARTAGIDALIEAAMWRDGRMAHDVESVVLAAVIAHDNGAPLLKVPIPTAEPGRLRRQAVERVVASVGVPLLFLGGPAGSDPDRVLDEVRDVMAGGGSGMAIGRTVYQHPSPAEMASRVAEIVHDR